MRSIGCTTRLVASRLNRMVPAVIARQMNAVRSRLSRAANCDSQRTSWTTMLLRHCAHCCTAQAGVLQEEAAQGHPAAGWMTGALIKTMSMHTTKISIQLTVESLTCPQAHTIHSLSYLAVASGARRTTFRCFARRLRLLWSLASVGLCWGATELSDVSIGCRITALGSMPTVVAYSYV